MIIIFEITIFIIILIIFFNVLINFFNWNSPKEISSKSDLDLTVLIPARNEESNIKNCLDSIGPEIDLIKEIIVLDDNSNDSTYNIVKNISDKNQKIKIKNGKVLKDGWVGKSFACWQLSEYAETKWILFLDSDVILQRNAISKLIYFADKNQYSMISAWPKIFVKSFAEKIFMPLLNFIVFTTFPTSLSEKSMLPSLGLAHGACILFKRSEYKKLGGHNLVKNSLFEDTLLARKWREKGSKSICINGANLIKVRMYNNFYEIWKGFEKNAYPAFSKKISFLTFHTLRPILFLLPYLYIPFYLMSDFKFNLYLSLVFMLTLIRLLMAIKFRHPVWSILFHPIAEIVFIIISISSFIKFTFLGGVQWKDRNYK